MPILGKWLTIGLNEKYTQAMRQYCQKILVEAFLFWGVFMYVPHEVGTYFVASS